MNPEKYNLNTPQSNFRARKQEKISEENLVTYFYSDIFLLVIT